MIIIARVIAFWYQTQPLCSKWENLNFTNFKLQMDTRTTSALWHHQVFMAYKRFWICVIASKIIIFNSIKAVRVVLKFKRNTLMSDC